MDDKLESLQKALDAGGVGTWDYNPLTGEISWSAKCYEIFGFTKGTSIAYETWLSIVHPDDRIKADSKVHNTLFDFHNNTFDAEYRIITPEKELRWVKATGKVFFNEQHCPVQFTGTAIDITEHKKAEEALLYRKALLEAQNETTNDGILTVDAKGNILSYNKRFLEIWEIPQEIAAYKNDEEALKIAMSRLENPKEFIDRVKYLYEHPDITTTEEIQFKDGRIIERDGRSIIGENNYYYGWVWYFRDITQRKSSEQELKQKNKELRKLIQEFEFLTDFIPQMVWTTRPDGYNDFFNKQWKEYTGLKFEETMGEGWLQILHPEDVERTIKKWSHSLQTGEPLEIEYRLRRFDGMYRWFLGRGLPMRDENQQIIKWFGTSTDINDQKMMADILEQKVEERTLELREANTQLEQSNKELEQFAYVASHDLQEPVRKIRTFMDLVSMDLERKNFDKAIKTVDKMKQTSFRMQELIKDLLDFSRLNRSKNDAFKRTDLNEVLLQVLEDLELIIEQKQANISAATLPVLSVIPLQMNQLIYNLVNNSLKFSKPNVPPRIHISSQLLSVKELQSFTHLLPNQPYYRITFTDNGIGFNQEYAVKIFTIFQRLHTRSEFEGTGIGLALCKKIALNHKGDIYAEAEEHKGASFHILLPAEQSGAE